MADDDFDVRRVLEGFRPVEGVAPDLDPTRALDGWRAESGSPTPRRSAVADAEDARIVLDVPFRQADAPTLPRIELPPRMPAKHLIDVEELGAPGRSASRFAAAQLDVEDVEIDWQPTLPLAGARGEPLALVGGRPSGLLDAWAPGAWIAAVRQVLPASAEVVETPQGPVVEPFPPHLLLALWAPAATPLPGRWPHSVRLTALPPDQAAATTLPELPPGAKLWLCDGDAFDWALLGEMLLLHDEHLRDFQFKGLRAFVDAEREAAFKRLNDDFRQPAAGQPVQRKPAA